MAWRTEIEVRFVQKEPFRREVNKNLSGSKTGEFRAGESRLSGNVIASELLRNMELGRFEMAYTVLLPCVFTIYLNPEDHAQLRGVFPLIIEDARRALRARVTELNEQRLSRRQRNAGTRKEYRIACREWELDFLAEAEVPPGDVEIHSELNEAPMPAFRGTRTTLIGREPSVTRLLRPDDSDSQLAATLTTERIYAAIHYQDDAGPQTYFVTKNQVRIGRGGDGETVDLVLRSTDEISRNHLVIRRDAATGEFSAVDASTNGTWVNGKRLEKGAVGSLPSRARIGLGEVLTLLFEVHV